MTKILAIDTATEACSAALLVEGVITSCAEVAPQAHTRKILPMCEQLLHDAGLTLGELDVIAFGRGPGSFTGVRIGIGVAQGLAFGAGKQLIAISDLAALAQGCHRRTGAERVFCAIDARMNEVYFAAFTLRDGIMEPLADESVLAPELAAACCQQLMLDNPGPWLAIGTGFSAYAAAFACLGEAICLDAESLPWAQDMLVIAQQPHMLQQACEPALATPVYLRDKVTWKKLPGRE